MIDTENSLTARFQQLYLLKATEQNLKAKSGYFSMPFDPDNQEENDIEFDEAVELRDQGNSEEALRIFRRIVLLLIGLDIYNCGCYP